VSDFVGEVTTCVSLPQSVRHHNRQKDAPDLRLRTSDLGLQTSDFGPRTSDLGLQPPADHLGNEGSRLTSEV
jgi:hypothetical protein